MRKPRRVKRPQTVHFVEVSSRELVTIEPSDPVWTDPKRRQPIATGSLCRVYPPVNASDFDVEAVCKALEVQGATAVKVQPRAAQAEERAISQEPEKSRTFRDLAMELATQARNREIVEGLVEESLGEAGL